MAQIRRSTFVGKLPVYEPARPQDPNQPPEDWLTTEQMAHDPWVMRKAAECAKGQGRACGQLGDEYNVQTYVVNSQARAIDLFALQAGPRRILHGGGHLGVGRRRSASLRPAGLPAEG
nr:hypothetical protein [Phenylobacterium sp.]